MNRRDGIALVIVVCILGVGLELIGGAPPKPLPSATMIGAAFAELFASGELGTAVRATLIRLGVGFSLSVIVGVALGVVSLSSDMTRRLLGACALMVQALPSICWVPFALVFFGSGELAILFVTVLGSVGAIYTATQTSVMQIPPTILEAAATMGSRGAHRLVSVTLPAAAPSLLIGLRQGLAFAWRSLMAAEVYVALSQASGLGALLHEGRADARMDLVFAVMGVILLVGLIVELGVFQLLERGMNEARGRTASPYRQLQRGVA